METNYFSQYTLEMQTRGVHEFDMRSQAIFTVHSEDSGQDTFWLLFYWARGKGVNL